MTNQLGIAATAGLGFRAAGMWGRISGGTGELGDFVFGSHAVGAGIIAGGMSQTRVPTGEPAKQTCGKKKTP